MLSPHHPRGGWAWLLLAGLLLAACRNHLALMKPLPGLDVPTATPGGPPPQALYHYVMATRARLEGDLDQAERSLHLALLFDPHSPHLYRVLAEVAFQQGDPQAAEASFHKALALERYPSVLVSYGTFLLLQRDPQAAEAMFQEALSREGSDGAWRGLVESLLAQGRFADTQQALARWRQAGARTSQASQVRAALTIRAGDPCAAQHDLEPHLRQAGASGEGLDLYLLATRGCGHYDSALGLLEHLTLWEPTNPDLHYRLASLASELGDPFRALPAWQQLNRLEGAADADVLLQFARSQTDAGQADQALGTLARLHQQQPDMAGYRYEAARALYLSGDTHAALDLFAAAPPTNQPEYLLNAHLLLQANRPEAARALLESGLKRLGPLTDMTQRLAVLEVQSGHEAAAMSRVAGMASWTSTQRVMEQARLLTLAGEIDDALETLARAEAEHPDEPRLPIARAHVLLTADRAVEAVDLLRKASDRFPREATILRLLAYGATRIAQPQTALSAYHRALRLKPGDVATLNDLAYLLLETGDPDQALPLALEAVEQRPGEAAYLDTLGWTYYQQGRLVDAIRALEHAVQLSPTEPILREHLREAYGQAGRGSDAQALSTKERFPPPYDGRSFP